MFFVTVPQVMAASACGATTSMHINITQANLRKPELAIDRFLARQREGIIYQDLSGNCCFDFFLVLYLTIYRGVQQVWLIDNLLTLARKWGLVGNYLLHLQIQVVPDFHNRENTLSLVFRQSFVQVLPIGSYLRINLIPESRICRHMVSIADLLILENIA